MKIRTVPILLLILIKMTSCVNTRPIMYMQGQFDTSKLSQYVAKVPVIQIGDLISINVFSDNPEATILYNLPNGSAAGGGGYLVDSDGNIQFQGIGKLRVSGLTKEQLIDLLDSKLTAYLKSPYYNIRFLNYKVTLLGEVNREGIFTVPNERLNIFDAIGLAGGLTVFARRENVLVIREANGKREFARLDLTNPEVMNSPYYFLQQNDLVVVDPSRGKSTATEQVTVRNVQLASTVISTIAIIYSLLIRNR